MTWRHQIATLHTSLQGLLAMGNGGALLDHDEAFQQLCLHTRALAQRSGTVFLVGNGASASMASHVAADLAKNARIRTEVFSDLSLITAIANDISYDEVFAEPLRRRMRHGDMLCAISSSGNSPNVLRAVCEARALGGYVLTLSAMSATNRLRCSGDLNFWLPAETYGLAETGHAAILHYWIDRMVEDCAL